MMIINRSEILTSKTNKREVFSNNKHISPAEGCQIKQRRRDETEKEAANADAIITSMLRINK